MDDAIEVSVVEHVETVDERLHIVTMRVLKGRLRLGTVLNFAREANGRERSVALTVRRIWLFTREVDLLDPPYSGKLELTGDAKGELGPGSTLLRKAESAALFPSSP